MPINHADDSVNGGSPAFDPIEAAPQESIEVLKRKQPSKTYLSEFKRYKKWLRNNDRTCDEEGRYLTDNNLEAYWTLDMAPLRNGNQGSLKRARNVLQRFAAHCEP